MTLYVGSALEGQQPCNREDREGRCNANDGEPCDDCAERAETEAAYWFGQWKVAPLEERDPDRYRTEMREAGRGHLVKP